MKRLANIKQNLKPVLAVGLFLPSSALLQKFEKALRFTMHFGTTKKNDMFSAALQTIILYRRFCSWHTYQSSIHVIETAPKECE